MLAFVLLMTMKRGQRQQGPSERDMAALERLKKKAEIKKAVADPQAASTNESALEPMIAIVSEEEARAALVAKALEEEAEREQQQKLKLAERKKRRRQAQKKHKEADFESSASSSSESDSPAPQRKSEVVKAAVAVKPATPTKAPAPHKKQVPASVVYVPRRSLAEEVEDAYVEQVCLSDRVGILASQVSETSQLYESVNVETEKLRLEIATMESEMREHERLEKDIPNLQRRVESLRRELENLDHQRIRAKQDFEIQSARRLKPMEEELELAYRVLENRRREEPDLSKEERHLMQAKQDFENEKAKLDEAISLYGLDPKVLTEDFWLPKAPESLLESALFKQCESQIAAAFEKERKFQIKRVNEDLAQLDKSVKIISNDVLTYLINNGQYGTYTDAVKQAVKRVCLKAQDLRASKAAVKPITKEPQMEARTQPPPPPAVAPLSASTVQGALGSPSRRDRRDNREHREIRDQRDNREPRQYHREQRIHLEYRDRREYRSERWQEPTDGVRRAPRGETRQ
jgi:hypothetical protein